MTKGQFFGGEIERQGVKLGTNARTVLVDKGCVCPLVQF